VQSPPSCPEDPTLQVQLATKMLPARESECAGQPVQFEMPPSALYVPATHFVQTPPSGPVHPALHVQAVKVALFLAELELSGQASHAVKVLLEYLPASHSMQSSEEELPSVDKCVPAGQS